MNLCLLTPRIITRFDNPIIHVISKVKLNYCKRFTQGVKGAAALLFNSLRNKTECRLPTENSKQRTLMVNMCFLVNKEKFVAGEQSQKPGGKFSHYDVLRGCVVAMGIEGMFADWAS